MSTENRYELNKNLAQMLKGGVIMDVTTPEQAKIAEAAGAAAVMALERIPADIRAAGGVSRMSDPKMIKGIQDAVSIPVMAKCRIGHFASKPSKLTTSTKAKYSPPLTIYSISISTNSKCRSSAEPVTSAKPSAASKKALP